MLRFFIGYDEEESINYHVLAHSILKRSSYPVQITPLRRETLGKHYHRPRDTLDSTDFSNSRWIVPHLSNYEGVSIFLDCDMLCLDDPGKWLALAYDLPPVSVVKHDYKPHTDKKFLDREQTKYNRKNWSSFMIFNNAKCRMLTKHIVNTMTPALWFHQFRWLPDEDIGALPKGLNTLVGYDEPDEVCFAHFTDGSPAHGYNDSKFADLWWQEYYDMLHGTNPVDYLEIHNARSNPDEVRGEDQQQAAQ